jgi:hypothetical protein
VRRLLRRLKGYLLPRLEVTFETEFRLDEAVQRLRLAAAAGSRAHYGQECLAGDVRADKVRLYRLKPYYGNGYAPVFIGRFVRRDGRVVLEGAFQLQRFVRLHAVFLYSVAALAFVDAIALGVLGSLLDGDPMAFLFAPGALAAFAVGAAFVRLSWRGSSIELVSASIARALGSRRI